MLGVGCGLWLWHSLDFSITFIPSDRRGGRGHLCTFDICLVYSWNCFGEMILQIQIKIFDAVWSEDFFFINYFTGAPSQWVINYLSFIFQRSPACPILLDDSPRWDVLLSVGPLAFKSLNITVLWTTKQQMVLVLYNVSRIFCAFRLHLPNFHNASEVIFLLIYEVRYSSF